MPRVPVIGRRTKPGVKALRVLAGGKGHRPSGFNMCIAEKLKGQSHPAPGPNELGGMRNKEWQKRFIQAAKECGANIREGTLRKWGL